MCLVIVNNKEAIAIHGLLFVLHTKMGDIFIKCHLFL